MKSLKGLNPTRGLFLNYIWDLCETANTLKTLLTTALDFIVNILSVYSLTTIFKHNMSHILQKPPNRTEPPALNGFLFVNNACCWWHFKYPKWWDLFKQAHQHLACLACHGTMISVCHTLWVTAPWLGLIFAYSDHWSVPVFFLLCLGFLLVGYITDTLVSWDLSQARGPGLQTGLGG